MKLNFRIYFLPIFFILSNCSISLQSIFDAVNYSKNSADFLSYVATDKTTTDHALSYIFQKDCSLTRSLKFKKICEEINKENLANNKKHLILKKETKFYKQKSVNKLKKIKVPSMAY